MTTSDLGDVARVLRELDVRLGEARTSTELTHAAAQAVGSALKADRAGYALADATVGSIVLAGLWGLPLATDTAWSFEDLGVSAEDVEAGAPIWVNDVLKEHPDHPGRHGLIADGTRAYVVAPVIERGRVVAALFVQSRRAETWGEADIDLVVTVAERVRAARVQARIESRRRESDQQMMTIADAMPIQVWAADNYGMLYWHNRRVVEFSGVENSDLDGFGYQDIIHPDDLPKALEDWYRSLASGTGHETSFRTRRADGEYRWFVCRSEPILDEDGNVIRYLGTSTDIHNLKCAEEELARINHDLEAEVEARTQERDLTWKTASDLFVVTTPKMESFRLNPAWSRMLGWTEAEILTREGSSFIHPEDVKLTYEWLATLKNDGDRALFENRLLRRDGGFVWISWIVTRHRGMNYSTGRDITATRNLIKTQQDLAHASRVATLGELTASIAHEVNQPLAALVANGKAATRWLTRASPDLDEAKAALARMVDEAKRASDIIDRIRSLALRGEKDRAPVDVAVLLDDVAALLRGQLRSLGANLVVEVAADVPAIVADRIQMQQVLINLVLNAAQAMAQADSEDRSIEVAVTLVGEEVRVSVSDTGPGVGSEAAAKIFDPFYTTKEDGMGMGLSIARTIMEAHGGSLRIDDRCDRGTRFVFTVPSGGSHPSKE